jgi:hypothetical protein
MSVVRPRNRLIYFRVSEDEYQEYNRICESTGSRSISDLARSAMQHMAQNGRDHRDPVSEKLTILETLVIDLSRKVHQLAVSVGRPLHEEAGPEPNGLTID